MRSKKKMSAPGYRPPIGYPVMGTDIQYDVKSAYGTQKGSDKKVCIETKKGRVIELINLSDPKAMEFANSVL